MKRFRFQLQSLLKLRSFEEEAAQRALGEALRKAEAQRDRIRTLEQDREELLSAASEQAGCDPVERQRMSVYLMDLNRRLSAECETLKALEEAVLQRREVLHAASKARKALEKLRDRRHETFLEERRRREYAEVDEAVLQRLNRHEAAEEAGS